MATQVANPPASTAKETVVQTPPPGSPSATTTSGARNFRLEAFDELETMDARNPSADSRPPKKEVAAKVEAEKAAKPPGPETKKAAEAPAKQAEEAKKAAPDKPLEKKEGDQPKAEEQAKKPEETAEPDPSAKYQLAHDLRKAFRSLHKENQTLKAQFEEMRSAKPAPQKNEERTALASENETLKKRLEELETEIKFSDFTKSSEFKDKFEKPFQAALADAYEEVKELWVNTPEGEQRVATSNDFDRILDAAPQDVRKLAKEMFGDYAEDALNMRRKLVDLRKNADREAKRYREEAKTREQQRISEQAKMREEAETMWRSAHERLTAQHPEWFGHVEGDDELNQAIDVGLSTVDKAFDKNLPLAERVERQAANRLTAAAFRPNRLRIKRLEARVQELEAALKEYEESKPGEGDGSRAGSVSEGSEKLSNALDELDELERKIRG